MEAQQVDENIWTMIGPDLVFAGAGMHTRMTVVRLSDGGLWVHSPIELIPEARALVAELGDDVVALIAPNKFHHLFIEAWCEAYPQAKVYAEPDLMRKVPSLAEAQALTDDTPSEYAKDIDQIIFGGNRMFQEAVFFHKSSGTLMFTDLVINLKTDTTKWLPKLFLAFEGVRYPNGGVPRLYKWMSKDKDRAREVLATIRGWQPKRLLFCHGEPFDISVEELLDREFSYLN